MERAWSKTVVVLFWIATMSWLVIEKVLPPLASGEPPTINSIYGGMDPEAAPICWNVSFADKPIGWAMVRAARPASGMLEINSHVHFARVPLKELAAKSKAVLLEGLAAFGPLAIDARNRVEIDPLHRLKRFHSSIQIEKMQQTITIDGAMEGSRLRIHIDLGTLLPRGVPGPSDQYLPTDALVIDQLSPQARLPGLRVGQTWTEPVYNPMSTLLGGQMELLQAVVEGKEQRSWNNKAVETLRVVYHKESGSSSTAAANASAKMWVMPDGAVIRQAMLLADMWLVFDRLSPDDKNNLPPGLTEALRHFGNGSHGGDEPPPMPRRSILPPPEK